MNIIGILQRWRATGRATGPYPAHEEPPPPVFRGMPALRAGSCEGAADCALICPTGAVRVDRSQSGRRWRLDMAACIGCGLCIDACPNDALGVSPAFELAARTRADLIVSVVFHGPNDIQPGVEE